jgi:hypothetical protein
MFEWWPSWDQWETIGKVAPIATAVIALGAAGTAVATILIQRDIAKRRAAIDFFLKTDLDREIISLYDRFKKIDVSLLRSTPIPTKLDLVEYKDARAFLNICELIAVGVNKGAFSESVAKAYWGDVLPNAYRKMRAFIRDVRASNDEGGPFTYSDLEQLCDKWSLPEYVGRRTPPRGAGQNE